MVPALRHVDLRARARTGATRTGSTRRSTCASRSSSATDEALVVWTTTPWTLPANVAAAVKPDAEYGLLETGEWVAVALCAGRDLRPTRARGGELVGLRYRGPFDDARPGRGVEHRVIPWDDVDARRRAPASSTSRRAAAPRTSSSRASTTSPCSRRSTSRAASTTEYGWLHGLSTVEAADQIVGDLGDRGLLVAAETYEHRYPLCWRCDTPLIFRISDDWFIAVDELRPQLLDANATVEWTPAYMGKRMDDWLRNMGDWNISRRRYYGLPLPIYPCACGHLNVIGSRAELEERARVGLEQLEELRRPWIDEVPIRCEACGEDVRADPGGRRRLARRRHRPVLDARLGEPGVRRRGLRRPARRRGSRRPTCPITRTGRSGSPPTGSRRCASRSGSGSTRSSSCRSCSSAGRRIERVLGYEKMLDEHGREMHGSWGNMIDARGRVRAHGRGRHALAVLRAAARTRTSSSASARRTRSSGSCSRSGTRASSSSTTRTSRAGRPTWEDLADGAERRARAARPLARRAHARARRRGDRGVRELAHGRRRPCVRVVRRRRLELVHPALAPAVLGRRPGRAAHALVRARAGAARRRAAHAVPHRSPLARADRAVRGRAELRASRRLAGRVPSRTRRSSPRSRSSAASSSSDARRVRRRALKLRQPLRALVVEGAPLAESHADEIADELRVRDVSFGHVDASELRVKPNLPLLGPKLGKELGAVRAALQAGDFEELAGRRHPRRRATSSRATRCSSSGTARRAGRSRRRTGSPSRSTSTSTTSSCARGRVYDLIHAREHDAQGGRARAHRPHRADDPRGGRRPARARGVDRARDARRVRRRRRQPSSRSRRASAARELELAAELDGKPERHVLLDEPVRLDVRHAARAEPVADAGRRASRAPTRRT